MANSEATQAEAEACGINLRTANEQLLNFFQQTMTGLHIRNPACWRNRMNRSTEKEKYSATILKLQQNVAVAFKSRYVKLRYEFRVLDLALVTF